MNKGKAIGVQTILTEALLVLGDFSAVKLTYLYNDRNRSVHSAEDLTQSVSVILPKKLRTIGCLDRRRVYFTVPSSKIVILLT